MEKILGTNLGNWLVLEKWMKPDMFDGVDAEDETWLNRRLDRETLEKRMKEHRDTYVTEDDFRYIAEHGLNTVRIPVPYFIFGDREPFIGCIEYLDKAFDWAEKYGIQILIDLHTVPGSQNGYDNGGICGVCNWCKKPEEVEFALTVLERLAERYKDRKGLFGIEVLNEPISFPVYMTSPTHNKWVDAEEARGSSFVPLSFLKPFYRDAYRRLRAILSDDKAIVFHDGFRLSSWNGFFDAEKMTNVYLDAHIYIFAMENFVPFHKPWLYKAYIGMDKLRLKSVQKHVNVIVGEWCICTKYCAEEGITEEERIRRCHEVAKIEMDAWDAGKGWFYWNYQLRRDRKEEMDLFWKNFWDLSRCMDNGWFPDLKKL